MFLFYIFKINLPQKMYNDLLNQISEVGVIITIRYLQCFKIRFMFAFNSRMEAVRDGYNDGTYGDTFRQFSESAIRVAPHRTGKTYTWKMKGYTHCSASCLGGT